MGAGAAAGELHAGLAGRVVHRQHVVALAAVLARLQARQNPVGVPLRTVGAVEHAADRDWPVAVAPKPANEHLFTRAWHVHCAPATAGIRKRRPDPAAGTAVVAVEPVPVEAHLDPVQFIGADQLVLSRDHGRGLDLHHWLVMLERAAVRQRPALRFDLDDKETGAAVGMAHCQSIGIASVRGTQGFDVGLQAARHLPRCARHGQVVLDPPDRLDHDELPVFGAAARLAFRVVHQFNRAPGIGAPHAARTAQTLGSGLPLLDANSRLAIAPFPLTKGIGAGVFVHLGLPRQATLSGDWHGGALGPSRRGGVLVIEGARGQLRAVEFASFFPVREAVDLVANATAAERHLGRSGRRQGLHAVHDHHRVRLAVFRLLEIEEQPFLFHQPVREIPVVLVLLDKGTDRQWITQDKAKRATGARVLVEYVGENLFDGLVLPVACIVAIAQEMQP
ncbi:hypothetical protein GO286_05131 [Ralstonia solanacearum]|nr:hypothetical protein [Ralstonia solanacearum]